MRLIKVGLGNVNTTVGKVTENTDKIIQQAEMMADSLVTIGVFPEQVIGGYPPEDLVQWSAFVEPVKGIAAFCEADSGVIVGIRCGVGDRADTAGAPGAA
jgi:NAD+ synthase (glutamine-hydrolysing)